MATDGRRRNFVIVLLLAIIAIVILLLLRCRPGPAPTPPTTARPAPSAPAEKGPTGAASVEEVLTPAVVTVPAQVGAGAEFDSGWTGPNNPGDYLTIPLNPCGRVLGWTG
ncbi:MAG: hypothetical protein IT437_04035 [Phycisphaerales bacterium]|nr:hypothetical protein [Phycisphaerales bacterium]